jgi:hypothetical protein
MNIIVQIENSLIRASAGMTMAHCNDKKFIDFLASVVSYNHTTLSSLEVSQKLYAHAVNIDITIEGYKSVNPWSKVIGHAKGATIYLNTRKLRDLDIYERCGNFYHEFCHLAGFEHKGNSVTKYNLETVPYKAGKIFENYLRSEYSQRNANKGSFKL